MQRALITLIPLFAVACASGDPDAPPAEPGFEEIFVSKNDVDRAAAELEVRAIEVRPGESIEAALQRAGVQRGSLDELVAEARRAPRPPAPDDAPEADPDRCDDTCVHALDGICDDGTRRDGTDLCARGTDCTDCDRQADEGPGPDMQPDQGLAADLGVDVDLGVEVDMGVPPDNVPPPQNDAPDRCTDTCAYARDGECDDGSAHAVYALCARGTDCTDCDPDRAPMQPPQNDAPDSLGRVCVVNGRDGICKRTGECDGLPRAGGCSGPNVQCCLPADVPPEQADPDMSPPQQCLAMGRPGICIDTGACTGASVPGHCRGADNIQCCVPNAAEPSPAEPQQCLAMGRPGVCIDTGACTGASVPGHCRGADNIQCCVPNAAEPEPAPAEPQQCLAMGRPGICIDTGACDGASVPGHCRGADNIQCCVANQSQPAPPAQSKPAEGQACLASGSPGVCENTATCQGSSYPGHCAGDESIRCCVPDAIEEKAICFGFCIGSALAFVVIQGGRQLLFYAVRRRLATAGARHYMGTVRSRSAGNAQVVLRATNNALAVASATAAHDPTRTFEGDAGDLTDRWRQQVATDDSAAEEDDAEQAPPMAGLAEGDDADVRTNAAEKAVECEQSGVEDCVIERRQRQGSYTTGGQKSRGLCDDDQLSAFRQQKNAACNQNGCAKLIRPNGRWVSQGPWAEASRAAQAVASGANPGQAAMNALEAFCRHNKAQMDGRAHCMQVRQQVVDECWPGEIGDEAHRCEYCEEKKLRDACQQDHYIDMNCQIFDAMSK